MRFPPIELDDTLGSHAPGFEVHPGPQRCDERHVELGELTDSRIVEMVVVIVRDDHEIERRHCAQKHRHRLEPLGAKKPQRRRARSPHRIGEHPKAVDFDQQRRMAEPGRA